MSRTAAKQKQRKRRHARSRARIRGSADRPRVSVFRSNQHLYVQLIDDETETTLSGFSDIHLKQSERTGKTKTDIARALGKQAGEYMNKHNITAAVFDTGGRAYHGRVQAVAEGLREAGIHV